MRSTRRRRASSGRLCVSRVSIWAGAIAFTVMECWASSTAMVRVSSMTPALAALYPTRFSTPRKPLMEAVVMIRPPPCLTICRAAAWQQRKTPVRLTRSTRCHWASGCSRNGAECAIPALANITSSRPNAATTASTKACTCPASPTSTRTAMAWPPPSRISRATAAAASCWTSPSATRAPSAAKASPVARPIPSAPPVSAVTRPCKRIPMPPFLYADDANRPFSGLRQGLQELDDHLVHLVRDLLLNPVADPGIELDAAQVNDEPAHGGGQLLGGGAAEDQ